MCSISSAHYAPESAAPQASTLTASCPRLQGGRLGSVVFQFHLSFKPSEANQRHVEHCRRMLAAHIPMAVEFRDRGWFQGAPPPSGHTACTAEQQHDKSQ
jgi:uncharacterized protein YecE (DUF72 family)